MHGFSVLPRGLPSSLAAGALLGALPRRPLSRPGHRQLLFCLAVVVVVVLKVQPKGGPLDLRNGHSLGRTVGQHLGGRASSMLS